MFCRLKSISNEYPVFNERTEDIWKYNAKFDKDLRKHSNELKAGIMNKNILNDICVEQGENDDLPSSKKCSHNVLTQGNMRYVCKHK